MIGKHHVKVSNRNVHFSFDITRNITVIRGDSATGKTTLINLLSEYENFGRQSGVTLVCDKRCRVLTETDWEIRLQNMRDSIIFIDEGNRFIKSTDFARCVRESDNYYVIITRESLYNLPYSVEEIYEMRKIRHNMTLSVRYITVFVSFTQISLWRIIGLPILRRSSQRIPIQDMSFFFISRIRMVYIAYLRMGNRTFSKRCRD